MPDFLTAEASVDTVDIPTPPVELDRETVSFPTFGPFRLPDIDFGPFRFDLPDVSIPEVNVPVPSVDVRTDFESLPDIGPIPDVDVDLPFLDIDTDPVTIPVVDYTIWVVDPFGSELVGGDVDISFYDIDTPGFIPVPDVDVRVTDFPVGGQFFRIPDVDIPGIDVRLPDIPELSLPDVAVPVGARLTGSFGVADPTTLSVSVGVEWGSVQSFVLQPIPGGFLTEPVVWAFESVLSELESRITVDTAKRIEQVLDGFLELLLSDETKQKVNDLRREE